MDDGQRGRVVTKASSAKWTLCKHQGDGEQDIEYVLLPRSSEKREEHVGCNGEHRFTMQDGPYRVFFGYNPGRLDCGTSTLGNCRAFSRILS
jgi:hypothetical protein